MAEPAMAIGNDISGAPLQTRQTTAHALAKRGGVVLPDNDNIRGTGRPGGHRLDRNEADAAVHRLGDAHQVGEPVAVREQREQLGVLSFGLEVLRSALQVEGLLRHLGRRAGVRMLAALDLDGETRRQDRERARSAAAGAAKGQ
jgi:hypothetical protein